MKKWLRNALCTLGFIGVGFGLSACTTSDLDNIEFRYNEESGYVQYYVDSEGKWQNIITKDELLSYIGEDIKGKDGIDGREVEFRVTDTEIQWRYVDSNSSWTKLMDIEDLKGENFIVTFDYNYPDTLLEAGYNYKNMFSFIPSSIELERGTWLGTRMPSFEDTVLEDCFLGWFVKGTDIQISAYEVIGGDVELVAKWSEEEIEKLLDITPSKLINELSNVDVSAISQNMHWEQIDGYLTPTADYVITNQVNGHVKYSKSAVTGDKHELMHIAFYTSSSEAPTEFYKFDNEVYRPDKTYIILKDTYYFDYLGKNYYIKSPDYSRYFPSENMFERAENINISKTTNVQNNNNIVKYFIKYDEDYDVGVCQLNHILTIENGVLISIESEIEDPNHNVTKTNLYMMKESVSMPDYSEYALCMTAGDFVAEMKTIKLSHLSDNRMWTENRYEDGVLVSTNVTNLRYSEEPNSAGSYDETRHVSYIRPNSSLSVNLYIHNGNIYLPNSTYIDYISKFVYDDMTYYVETYNISNYVIDKVDTFIGYQSVKITKDYINETDVIYIVKMKNQNTISTYTYTVRMGYMIEMKYTNVVQYSTGIEKIMESIVIKPSQGMFDVPDFSNYKMGMTTGEFVSEISNVKLSHLSDNRMWTEKRYNDGELLSTNITNVRYSEEPNSTGTYDETRHVKYINTDSSAPLNFYIQNDYIYLPNLTYVDYYTKIAYQGNSYYFETVNIEDYVIDSVASFDGYQSIKITKEYLNETDIVYTVTLRNQNTIDTYTYTVRMGYMIEMEYTNSIIYSSGVEKNIISITIQPSQGMIELPDLSTYAPLTNEA